MAGGGLESEIFVITGPMAAGKTTIAAELAKSFALGVHLEGDVFRRFIVSGRREVQPQRDERAVSQLRLRYRLTASAAQTYAEHGFSVVAEDVIAGPMLAEFVSLISWRPLRLTVLLPRLEVVAQRETSRVATGYRDWTLAELHELFAEETPRLGQWLDTSEQSPKDTVHAILSRPVDALIE
jgi:cytidylate kinase